LAFNDFVQFFFTVKSTFSKFERNGSIHLYVFDTGARLLRRWYPPHIT
jgi:hypothetical protein